MGIGCVTLYVLPVDRVSGSRREHDCQKMVVLPRFLNRPSAERADKFLHVAHDLRPAIRNSGSIGPLDHREKKKIAPTAKVGTRRQVARLSCRRSRAAR